MDWGNLIKQIVKFFGVFTTSDGTHGVQVNIPFGDGSDTPSKFDGTELELNRKVYTELSTQGELSIDGVWECFTIECPRKSYEGSHVCIPEGTYFVEKYFSPDHGFDVLLLKDVPNRTSIEVHPANWAINPDTKKVYLLGCIAPGTSKDPNVVYNSKVAFAAVMGKMDWTKPIRIIVSE